MNPLRLVVGERRIGPGEPVFVIAEISANHGGSLERSLNLISMAAAAGADAVKVQTYKPDTMIALGTAASPVVGPGSPWEGLALRDLYAEAAMPWEWYPELVRRADETGIILFSTPFDSSAVDFLETQGAKALKIASFELTDLPLIAHAASTGLPLILSTGMATIAEIDDAVATATKHGSGGIALLRCNSAYPSPVDQMDLRTIVDMAERWAVPIGLSDHTMDVTPATVAVALGATIIEKHVTLARSDGGPDSSFSLEPEEFRRLVRAVRSAESALGNVRYGPSESDRSSLRFRRSLYVLAHVAAGEEFTLANLGARRPAAMIEPRHLDAIVGRVAAVDLPAGHPLEWSDVR